MKNFFDSVDELNRNDYFNIYINSLVKQFDPHSFYFSPNEKKLLTQVYLVNLKELVLVLKKINR